MADATDYLAYHHQLIEELYAFCVKSTPFSNTQDVDADSREDNQQFLSALHDLASNQHWDDEHIHQGQQCISRIVSHYPHITPYVPRDLFWFFGGDCLHFMPDEEIQLFQQLEDQRFAIESTGENVNYPQLRAEVFKLH